MPSKYAEDIRQLGEDMATLLERSKHTVEGLNKLNGMVGKLDDQVHENCQAITKLEERQSPLSVMGTAVSTGISSGVALAAAWFFGSQK